ncbi:unnamed protein product, partial [Prorocentrum cordatum]
VATQTSTSSRWTRPTSRRSLQDVIAIILRNAGRVAPALSIPGVTIDVFKVDWLHAVDQGVGADFVGALLWHTMEKPPGRRRAQQSDEMWRPIQAHCDARSTPDRLHDFKERTVKPKKAHPKFRGQAAILRHLIPFCKEATETHCVSGSAVDDAALNAMRHLHSCYHTLSGQCIFRKDMMRDSASRFATLSASLAALQPRSWRVKPKAHLLLEMAFAGGQPSLCWAYRGEDFGGSVGHVAKRRGSPLSATGFSRAVIARHRAQLMARLA